MSHLENHEAGIVVEPCIAQSFQSLVHRSIIGSFLRRNCEMRKGEGGGEVRGVSVLGFESMRFTLVDGRNPISADRDSVSLMVIHGGGVGRRGEGRGERGWSVPVQYIRYIVARRKAY